MRLLSLTLEHFRSYEKLSLPFEGRSIELFLGPNGSGKTNVLEAIGILSSLSSFSGVEHRDLIRWAASYWRVRSEVLSDGGERMTLEAVYQLHPAVRRAQFINDVRAAQAAFTSLVPTVTFLPQDLALFTGPPERRRHFLDELLSQLQTDDRSHHSEYERILKQRNALLKRIAAGEGRQSDVGLWDEQLASQGASIQRARMQLVERMNTSLETVLSSLGSKWKNPEFLYLRKTSATETEELTLELKQLLERSLERDILIGTTTVGPHRDDWRLLIEGKDLPSFASRGEQRTAFLALLLRSVDLVSSLRRERPVVLLDDVFSELDEAHQLALLEAIEDCQAFLTATHLPHAMTALSSLWHVEQGRVHRAGALRA